MIIQHKTCPWVKRRKYNDGVTDAIIKLKAKVKALAEDFKRLSTAKKVAIILGIVASIIGGAIAAIKVGKHEKAEELIKNAEQKLNEAQNEATRCAENLKSAINSNNMSDQQAAKASNEINQLNTLNKETKKIKRLIKAIKFDPENNNYEPINVKTKFKISSNLNPISAIQKARKQSRMRYELQMDLIAKKNTWDFISKVRKLTRDLDEITPEHINYITELLDKTLQKVKNKYYVNGVIDRLAPWLNFKEYREPILRLSKKYGYDKFL